jgi:hypothetical protein
MISFESLSSYPIFSSLFKINMKNLGSEPTVPDLVDLLFGATLPEPSIIEAIVQTVILDVT